MTRPPWDQYFMQIAHMVAQRSTCPRASVGCVIVYAGKFLVSTGYNGAKSGEDHCIDVGCDIVDGHCQRATHAEINALDVAEHVFDFTLKGMTLYSTHAPCYFCASSILASGISRVVYQNAYVPSAGLDLLSKNIQVERIEL